DKRFYRPGETVSISGQTFDESANRTGRYRVVAMLEPRSISGPELPPSPVKWPAGRPRQPGESGPLAAWGEEIELLLDPNSKDHSLELPLTETLAAGGQGLTFKLELTAYEGQTQIDSCSLDVQVLGDPQEQQNPLPNREFLAAFARTTGGREITDAELSLLNELWQRPSATVQELTETLYGNPAAALLATVRKLLDRLEAEGCVTRDRTHWPHHYTAVLKREELAGKRLQAAADELYDGDLTPLLTHLVRSQKLTA